MVWRSGETEIMGLTGFDIVTVGQFAGRDAWSR